MAVLALVSPLGAVSSAQAAVAKQSLSLSAPSSAETKLAFTVSGYGRTAKTGRPVVVQRLSGRKWIQVGRTTESSSGRYSVRTSVGSAGKFTYRAVASAWKGAKAVNSPSKVVSVHLPYILLTPSSPINKEMVKVTGKLPGVASRLVTVQRKSGTRWVTLVKVKTNRYGSYTTSFKAPAVGYSVRTLAPRVVVAGKVRAQYISSAKTLKVVAQTASLSIAPATVVPGQTAVAKIAFRPVRAGRAVELQVAQSGRWIKVAAGRQSATGTASLAMTAGTPAIYTYRAWTAARAGAPGFATPRRVLNVPPPVIPAPKPTASFTTSVASGPAPLLVTMTDRSTGSPTSWAWDFGDGGATIDSTVQNPSVTYATAGPYQVILTATNAIGSTTAAQTIMVTAPLVAPAASFTPSVTSGVAPVVVSMKDTSTGSPTSWAWDFGDGGATIDSTVKNPSVTYATAGLYLVRLTATNAIGSTTSAAQTITVTTTLPSISGMVTEAGPGNPGLVGVVVNVSSYSLSEFKRVTTGANGAYTVTGLAAGDDYQVCFNGAGATGGSSDAYGYAEKCYNAKPLSEVPTPVTAAAGAPTTGIDGALTKGGAIKGTVTEAAGAQRPLAGVEVSVSSDAVGLYTYVTTAAGGVYTVAGLAAGDDYQVCFYAPENLPEGRFVDQCYDSQPEPGVAVVAGAPRTGIDAAMVATGEISGTVTDTAAVGLAKVKVTVSGSSWAWDDRTTTTASDGSYTVAGLTPGSAYTVCFTGTDATGGLSDDLGFVYECHGESPSGEPKSLTVNAGAPTTGIGAELDEAGAISGTVTDAAGDGEGLGGVWVTVQGSSMNDGDDYGYRYASTAPDGSYTVKGLASGVDYEVCFSGSSATGGSSEAGYDGQCWDHKLRYGENPNLVEVIVGTTKGGINADLAGLAGITGKVTDASSGLGVEGIWVRASSQFNEGTNEGWWDQTDADGNYTVMALPLGTDYKVCFSTAEATGASSNTLGYVEECNDSQPTEETAPPITLSSGPLTRVDAALVVAGAFTGTVTEVGGAGLRGVSVTVSSMADGNEEYSTKATTGTGGNYTVKGLPTGTYKVCFAASGATGGSSADSGYVDQCFDNKLMSGADIVTVNAGATTPLISAVLVVGGAITGAVTSDADGKGLRYITVIVTSLSGRQWSFVTEEDGGYIVKGLPAGTGYQVCFTLDTKYQEAWYVDQCAPAPVTVTDRTITPGPNAELVGAGGMTGWVTEAVTLVPLTSVEVRVSSVSNAVNRSVETDPYGRWSMTGLPVGTDYQVCFVGAAATGGSSDGAGYGNWCQGTEGSVSVIARDFSVVDAELVGN